MERKEIKIKELWPYEHYITMDDVMAHYPPAPLEDDWKPQYKGPVVAWGRAVYETQPQEATDNLLRLVGYFHRELPPGNFWQLKTFERLPYPYAVYWPLGNAFYRERMSGRRFDWFIWQDDDVLCSPDDIRALIAAADPEKRPFVSALPYDRFEPHTPAVTEVDENGETFKWNRAPKSGTHPCHHVGLCLAIFHRSLFDRVPEPWFAAMPPIKGFSGVAPDWWWSNQMRKAGLTPHVCCDTNIFHLGRKLRIGRSYSEEWQDRHPKAKLWPEFDERVTFESPQTGAICRKPVVPFDGRDESAYKVYEEYRTRAGLPRDEEATCGPA